MTTATTSAIQVKTFFDLLSTGAKAALDVNLKTGDVVCLATKNEQTGAVGVGTPGMPYTADWTRVAACADGKLL